MIHLNPVTAIIGGLLLIAIGLLIIRGEAISRRRPRIRSVDADPRAWIDQRSANETDPGKRAAWRMIRDRNQEEL